MYKPLVHEIVQVGIAPCNPGSAGNIVPDLAYSEAEVHGAYWAVVYTSPWQKMLRLLSMRANIWKSAKWSLIYSHSKGSAIHNLDKWQEICLMQISLKI